MKQYEIDHLAIMWNKTKDEKYKEQWYKAVKLKSLVVADNKTSRDNSAYSPLQVQAGQSF
jgi:predicted HAD superfamily phosphohydrolase YqeG|tara:strand:- start:3353 stop:3532 length:180 start_codon:yes stop_codon:yes gene_type:complete